MAESNQAASWPFSLQNLLEELENFLVLESQKDGKPWISISELTYLFKKKYGVSPESVAEFHGYSDSLRRLLQSSKRFSIYGTSIHQDFYVAQLTAVIPSFQEAQKFSIQDKNKEPELLPKISSADDLEIALIKLINSLTANNSKKYVTIAVLSNHFCNHYKQPIRVVMRTVCPDMKLIELLQTIPSLYVQEVDESWQVTVDAHSIDLGVQSRCRSSN